MTEQAERTEQAEQAAQAAQAEQAEQVAQAEQAAMPVGPDRPAAAGPPAVQSPATGPAPGASATPDTPAAPAAPTVQRTVAPVDHTAAPADRPAGEPARDAGPASDVAEEVRAEVGEEKEHRLEQTRDLSGRTVPPPPRRRRGRVRRFVRSVVPPTLVLGLFIGAWFLVSDVLLAPDRRFLLPPPDDVLRIGFQDPQNRADLLNGLRLSATVALTGLGFSVLIGLLLAILMSQAGWIERSLYPYVVVLQTIPILALVPLFAYWFGYGYVARVVVCVLVSLFPIVANTLFGLRSVDLAHRELFALHGAGRLTRLVKLQLPAALPAIFTGLRIAAGLAVIGAIVGDYFFRQGQLGLGAMIDNYRYRLQAEQMFAAVLLSSLFGIAVFLVFGGVARRVAAWHQSTGDFPNR